MKRRPTVILAVAIVSLVAGWYVLLWSPMGKDVAAARSKKAAAESTAAELTTQLERLRDAQAHRPELDAALALAHTAIPAKAQIAEFILATNALSTRTGLDFLTISPTTPSAGIAGAPTTVAVSLTMQGGYHPTLDFLDGLMKLSRLMVIDSFQLNPETALTGQVSLSVSLTGRLFMAGLPPTAGTVAAVPAAPVPAP